MCLHIKGKVKTANRDIVCYKLLCLQLDTKGGVKLCSTVQGFKYSLNKLFTEKRFITSLRNEGYYGFHSYNKQPTVFYVGRRLLVKCVIPKGTKYYNGLEGQRMSESIIIKHIINKNLIKDVIKKAEFDLANANTRVLSLKTLEQTNNDLIKKRR